MSKNYRVYLDACCLNRLFDNQTQSRIALETQAILIILRRCQLEMWRLITSTALEAELNQTPDLEKINNIKTILLVAKLKVINRQFIIDRIASLQKLGFSIYDAANIASAERGLADILLTTDEYSKNSENTHI
jgi:predicted nucleic acid-binding protein